MVADLCRGRPRWLAIVGQRKVGKTSLLLEARQRYGSEINWVALDLYDHCPVGVEALRAYAIRVADAVLGKETGQSLEVAARHGDWVTTLLGCAMVMSLPEELRSFLAMLPTVEINQLIAGAIFDLPEQLAQATGSVVLIALDEFQELSSANIAFDVLALMRSRWQHHQRVAYVISGSEPSMLRELTSSQTSPFFQHFDVMELGEMARSDATALLRSASEGAFGDNVVEALLSLAGGHPFYLQVLGDELLRGGAPYDAAAIKDSVQRVLFSRTGRLGLYFQRLHDQLVGRSAYASATLSALSRGPLLLSEVAAEIGAPSGDTVRYLQRLGDAVWKRPDGRRALSDKTFGFWLAWRRPEGAVVPMTVLGDEGERLAAKALAAMGFDLIYQSRASRGAFDLLATRGATQLGVQVKRSPLPLTFSLAAWRRMQAEGERFGWRWVVAAVDETVRFMDPRKAAIKKTVRVRSNAIINNLLVWIDESRRS